MPEIVNAKGDGLQRWIDVVEYDAACAGVLCIRAQGAQCCTQYPLTACPGSVPPTFRRAFHLRDPL